MVLSNVIGWLNESIYLPFIIILFFIIYIICVRNPDKNERKSDSHARKMHTHVRNLYNKYTYAETRFLRLLIVRMIYVIAKINIIT